VFEGEKKNDHTLFCSKIFRLPTIYQNLALQIE
jgi:hypothetical protein